MQLVSMEQGPLRMAGALALDHRSIGLAPRRLPAWTRAQLPDSMVDLMVSMTSGVRIIFDTDANAIELELLPTTLAYVGLPERAAVIDLVIDGKVAERRPLARGNRIIIQRPMTTGTLERGEPSVVHFDGLGARMKRVEIWLPQAATIALRQLSVSDGAQIEESAPAARRWVHYGSSISHCMEADGPTSTWPAVAARLAGVDLQNIGLGGQCHLDQFVARTIRDFDADVISMKVGINIVNADSFRERTFISALNGFIDTVRDGHPSTPYLVVSPIICPAAEDHPGPTVPDADGVFGVVERATALSVGCLTLRRIRAIIADNVERRRAAGDEHLHYLDGLRLFGEGDVGDLPDGLHPNSAGYQRIGERFFKHAFDDGGAFAQS